MFPLKFLFCVSGSSSSFGCCDLGLTLESPTDFITLWSSASFANGSVNVALMRTTAAHFLENALSIELSFQALQCAIDTLSAFDINATIMFFHDKYPPGSNGDREIRGVAVNRQACIYGKSRES